MNIKDYISSGIVESYVLGLAEEAERAEFERMCAAHEEVRAARDVFEIMLEQKAFSNAVEPPKELKSKIFAEIESLKIQPVPVVGNRDSSIIPESTDQPARVVGLSWMRYLVAASLILLVGSTALNFYLFRQYKDYSTRYADLLASNSQLVSNSNALEARLKSYESDLAIIRNPDVAVVQMPGTNVKTSPDSNSLTTVYWDLRTKEVYLVVNNLPEPSSNQQYQLWALVDGKPVDAGVFDTKTSTALLKMKNIPRAQSFAITLEKRGGSESPTMSQLYVLGNVKT